jgi:hypothetical protein
VDKSVHNRFLVTAALEHGVDTVGHAMLEIRRAISPFEDRLPGSFDSHGAAWR